MIGARSWSARLDRIAHLSCRYAELFRQRSVGEDFRKPAPEGAHLCFVAVEHPMIFIPEETCQASEDGGESSRIGARQDRVPSSINSRGFDQSSAQPRCVIGEQLEFRVGWSMTCETIGPDL